MKVVPGPTDQRPSRCSGSECRRAYRRPRAWRDSMPAVSKHTKSHATARTATPWIDTDPRQRHSPGVHPRDISASAYPGARVDEPAERRRVVRFAALAEAESQGFSARAAHGGTPFRAADAYAGAAHSRRLVRLVELARASAEDALGAAAWLAQRVRNRRAACSRSSRGECGLLGAFQRVGTQRARARAARAVRRALGVRGRRDLRAVCRQRATRAAWLAASRAAGRRAPLNRWVRGLLAGPDPDRCRRQLPGPRLRRGGRRASRGSCRSRASRAARRSSRRSSRPRRPYTTAERAPEFAGPAAAAARRDAGRPRRSRAALRRARERIRRALRARARARAALRRRAARAGCRRAAAARGPRARRSAQRRSGRDSDRRARGPRRPARRRRARASAPARRLDRRARRRARARDRARGLAAREPRAARALRALARATRTCSRSASSRRRRSPRRCASAARSHSDRVVVADSVQRCARIRHWPSDSSPISVSPCAVTLVTAPLRSSKTI